MSESADTVSVTRAQFELGSKAAQLLDSLLKNPKHAPAIEAAIAAENPNATFPGRAAREAMYAPMEEKLAAETVKREALEKRLADREEREQKAQDAQTEKSLLQRMETVKSKRGFSDEMMEKVVARMREQNNPDIESAAAWLADTLPKPAPVVGHDFLPSTVDAFGTHSGDEAWKGLHDNPDAWQTKELRSIVRDPEFLALGNN